MFLKHLCAIEAFQTTRVFALASHHRHFVPVVRIESCLYFFFGLLVRSATSSDSSSEWSLL